MDGFNDESSVIVISALVTAKAVEVADPPPGVGLATTIVDVPIVAVSAPLSVIESCVDDATVGVLFAPLNVTVVFALYPVPVIVSVGVVPYGVDVGETVTIVGAGLRTCMSGDDEILVSVPSASKRDCVVKV